MPHTLIVSDRIEGTHVCQPNHEKIGTIQRLMVDRVSGNAAYAVLKFGGFLGLGNLLEVCAVFVFLGAVLLGAF
jgi:hypothetical protein